MFFFLLRRQFRLAYHGTRQVGSVLVFYYYYYYSLLIYEGIDRYIKAEYTLLYSTLDAYMPPVQGKSREYKPVEFNHPFGSHSRFDRIKRWKAGTVEPRFTDSRLTRTLC